MDMENERLRTKSNSLNKSIIFSFSPLLVCIYCFCSQLPKPFDGSYTAVCRIIKGFMFYSSKSTILRVMGGAEGVAPHPQIGQY